MITGDPDLSLITDPDFWGRAWEEAQSSCSIKNKGIDFWNKRALKYRDDAHSINQDRQLKVINMLKQEGILSETRNVLDVGCGDGTYALPFAKHFKSVTALDGAQEMLKLLDERATDAGLNNIKTLQRMWEDVDLVEEGIAHKFDLVFASMTPAICDYPTLVKMIQASKRHCCLISWARGSRGHVPQELWELVFKEDGLGFGQDIVFKINLLFSMGYLPVVRYFDAKWVKNETVGEAINNLCGSLMNYGEITAAEKDIISGYVRDNSKNGIYTQVNQVCLGLLLWSVDK